MSNNTYGLLSAECRRVMRKEQSRLGVVLANSIELNHTPDPVTEYSNRDVAKMILRIEDFLLDDLRGQVEDDE